MGKKNQQNKNKDSWHLKVGRWQNQFLNSAYFQFAEILICKPGIGIGRLYF